MNFYILFLHLIDDHFRIVHVANIGVASVVKVMGELGVAAADDENAGLLVGCVLRYQMSHVGVGSVPFEGLAAALLEEAVPVVLGAKLLVVGGQEFAHLPLT